MFKELLEAHKGKLTILAVGVLVAVGGAFAGVEVTSKTDGGICIGIAAAPLPTETP